MRDAVVDFVRDWSTKTELPVERFIGWLGIARGKFFDWRLRFGKLNEHNALVPRDHWLDESEKRAMIEFHAKNPLEGCRRLTFMMLDQNIAAASPASVYRVLSAAGLLDRWNCKPSKKGTGFIQPLAPHDHWHIDIAYLNLGGTSTVHRIPARLRPPNSLALAPQLSRAQLSMRPSGLRQSSR